MKGNGSGNEIVDMEGFIGGLLLPAATRAAGTSQVASGSLFECAVFRADDIYLGFTVNIVNLGVIVSIIMNHFGFGNELIVFFGS